MAAEHAHTGTKANGLNGNSGPNSARLGGARADFVAGIGRKVADLRATLGRVKQLPEDLAARDELRRKLHALGSAAKMMKFDAMNRGIGETLGTLDRAPREAVLDRIDLDSIEQIVEDLPALAWGDGRARSSRAESDQRALAPKYDVLVVGTSLLAEALVDDEAETRGRVFACEHTPDVQAAYEIVRSSEPDLVVLDADLSAATELVEALMDDPLTEAVPIVVVGSFAEAGEAARYVAMGVAKTVSKPTSREALRTICEETLNPERSTAHVHTGLGEPTLEELGERLAEVLREAIVGRADPSSRSRRIALGQGTEVLGAVWGAIARVREVVTARSDGAVRFSRGPEGAFTPGPLLSVETDVARGDRLRSPKRGPAAEVRLQGRRVVVADDDPAVVWFLADLLKTAGCIVYEAFDGQQALELAYKTAPDLVISDILMPNLDGFSLSRALRRDVALRDTPVILLSWKEDLLQRARELGANAAGYVRKESDTRAIIARVREALRTRGRIEARLREEGEVRGRLDGISIRSLLEVVCATRPEARVSVRDASFLYEVEIRMGTPHRATRTDGDGGFMKGTKVLAQMLGVSAGRFTVANSSTPIESELGGNLAAQLAKPVAKARAAVSLLTGPQLNTVARVRFDEEALADYLKMMPERARLAVRRLENGAAPRELVLCGGCEAALLDDILCDLAARGFVIGIESIDGEDMLMPAVGNLIPHTDTRASFAPRAVTPSPVPALADALVPEGACMDDVSAPICTSPTPGTAFEDAILEEIAHGSPEPAQALLPIVSSEAAPIVVALPVIHASELEDLYEGTPPAEQILALGEPTIVETTYREDVPEPSVAVELPSADLHETEESIQVDVTMSPRVEDLTPFAAVTASDDELAITPAKRKKWPMVAFVAATGVVAWAVLHFSTASLGAPKLQQKQLEAPAQESPLPPPAKTDKADEVYYTPLAPESVEAATGQGVIEVSAPEGAIVLVDGKPLARGATKVPASPGNHDVRVRKSTSDERGCTIDVHNSRVAHVRF
jgi:CheY-like chemotaxis protein